MTTSGTIVFSLKARDVISYALRKIGKVRPEDDPTQAQFARALTELNTLLKSWQKYDQIWRITEGYVNLVSDTLAYSLIPVPYRVIDMRYRDADDRDLPMREMTRQEYYEMVDKASNGTPTMWWFDRQQSTTSIFVWPVLLSATTETFRVTYQRRYEDVGTINEEIDVPNDYLELLGYNLGARLADEFGASGPSIDRVVARAEQLLNEALDDDREDFLQVYPDMMSARW